MAAIRCAEREQVFDTVRCRMAYRPGENCAVTGSLGFSWKGQVVKLPRVLSKCLAGPVLFVGALVSLSPAVADEVSKPAIESTRLVLLGTAGGPVIRQNRSQPSSLLVVNGSAYIIDAGVGSLKNLASAGLQAQDVDAIFITHHHLDHNGGLADLIQYSSFGRRSRTVSVIGPPGTTDMTDAAKSLSSISRRIFGSEGLVVSPDPDGIYVAKNIVDEGVVYQDDKVKVLAAENSHFRFRRGTPSSGTDRSYSYRFETPNGVVVFTGDTGPSDNVAKLAEGADILVAEVIDVPGAIEFAGNFMSTTPQSRENIAEHMRVEHLTPEELGKLASSAKVKSIVLTHFAPGADPEKTVEQYVAGIRRFYAGPVVAGHDLNEFSLFPRFAPQGR